MKFIDTLSREEFNAETPPSDGETHILFIAVKRQDIWHGIPITDNDIKLFYSQGKETYSETHYYPLDYTRAIKCAPYLQAKSEEKSFFPLNIQQLADLLQCEEDELPQYRRAFNLQTEYANLKTSSLYRSSPTAEIVNWLTGEIAAHIPSPYSILLHFDSHIEERVHQCSTMKKEITRILKTAATQEQLRKLAAMAISALPDTSIPRDVFSHLTNGGDEIFPDFDHSELRTIFVDLIWSCIIEPAVSFLTITSSLQTNIEIAMRLAQCYSEFIAHGGTISPNYLEAYHQQKITNPHFMDALFFLGVGYYLTLPHSSTTSGLMPVGFSTASFDARITEQLHALNQLVCSLPKGSGSDKIEKALTAFSDSVRVGIAPPVFYQDFLSVLVKRVFIFSLMVASSPHQSTLLSEKDAVAGVVCLHHISQPTIIMNVCSYPTALLMCSTMAPVVMFSKEIARPLALIPPILSVITLPHFERFSLKKEGLLALQRSDLMSQNLIFPLTIGICLTIALVNLLHFLKLKTDPPTSEEQSNDLDSKEFVEKVVLKLILIPTTLLCSMLYTRKIIAPIREKAAAGMHALHFLDTLIQSQPVQESHSDQDSAAEIEIAPS